MSHRREAEILLSQGYNENLARAQVHALLAVAETLTRQPEDLSPDEVLAIEHIRGGHQRGEKPRTCPICQAIAEVSHGGNCNRCGVPNLSPWVLRVWTATDDEPVRRTDVYLCSAHVPSDLPVEQSVVMRRTDSAMAVRYGRVIRPLLKFDGADACVITDFYLASKP